MDERTLMDEEFTIFVNMICDGNNPTYWAEDYFMFPHNGNLGIRWDGDDLGTYEHDTCHGLDIVTLDDLLQKHDPGGILKRRVITDEEAGMLYLFTEDQKIKYHELMIAMLYANKL